MGNKLNVIGKPTPKIDAGERVSGRSVYGHDLRLPGMLYGAILRSEHPHAIIQSIDTSGAKKLPGVVLIITADDADTNPIGYRRDHPILKKGEVNCIRDEIAAVAAETRGIAEEALRLIRVRYKALPGIFDPSEALLKDAPVINKFAKDAGKGRNISDAFFYEHGNLEEQKKSSAVIVRQQYTLPRVAHCCLATSNITADYSPSAKRLTLYSSTQVPFLYQRDMAHALKMNPSAIRVIQPVIGGGFGSKLDLYPYDATANFGGGGLAADRIQNFEPDGFRIGTNNRVNASGRTYYYATWKEVPGEIISGSYSGDGIDNRSITGHGFKLE